jgi:hypothetical protein
VGELNEWVAERDKKIVELKVSQTEERRLKQKVA